MNLDLPDGLIAKPYIGLALARQANAEWGARPGASAERAQMASDAADATRAMFRGRPGRSLDDDDAVRREEVPLSPDELGGALGDAHLRRRR